MQDIQERGIQILDELTKDLPRIEATIKIPKDAQCKMLSEADYKKLIQKAIKTKTAGQEGSADAPE